MTKGERLAARQAEMKLRIRGVEVDAETLSEGVRKEAERLAGLKAKKDALRAQGSVVIKKEGLHWSGGGPSGGGGDEVSA